MTALLCHNCFEPATYHGPRGNGTDAVYLLATPDDVARIFCSAECRDWWFDMIGLSEFEYSDVRVADGVNADTLPPEP